MRLEGQIAGIGEAGEPDAARSGMAFFLSVCNHQMGGCQNYGPFLGALNIRCRIIIGTQKGTIILTYFDNHPDGCRASRMVLGLGCHGGLLLETFTVIRWM